MTAPAPSGKPRALFYFVLLAVVAGLVWLRLHPFGGKEGGIGALIHPSDRSGVEASDTTTGTTSKEDTHVPAQRLPALRGISHYQPRADRTVRTALHAPRVPADRLLQRRGRYRRAPGRALRRRPARQDDRARAEFAVALLPAQRADRRRTTAH